MLNEELKNLFRKFFYLQKDYFPSLNLRIEHSEKVVQISWTTEAGERQSVMVEATSESFKLSSTKEMTVQETADFTVVINSLTAFLEKVCLSVSDERIDAFRVKQDFFTKVLEGHEKRDFTSFLTIKEKLALLFLMSKLPDSVKLKAIQRRDSYTIELLWGPDFKKRVYVLKTGFHVGRIEYETQSNVKKFTDLFRKHGAVRRDVSTTTDFTIVIKTFEDFIKTI